MKRFFSLLLAFLLTISCGIASGSGIIIPEIEVPRREIPENEAMRITREMKAGWNLGNTFDAIDCTWLEDKMDYETGWCGARTTEQLIEAVHAAGFRTLRLPVSWHNHLSDDWTVDADWMERVVQVASWAYDRGMYVIVNIHHDCDEAFYYPDSAHAKQSERYIRTLWQQIASRFADFDEHVIFEGINEPRLKGTGHEWWWDASNADCRDAMSQIVRLNQVFVDTVRATGGKNADRYLMVPSYDASPDYACQAAFSLPEDTAENRIIVSVHA